MKKIFIFTLLIASIFIGTYSFGAEAETEEGVDTSFRLYSTDFSEGEKIPAQNTCEGNEQSPEMEWDNVPEGTQSFALIMEDPEAPYGVGIHWVVYDLKADRRRLKGGAGNEFGYARPLHTLTQGLTDFGNNRYGGPCPPKRSGYHNYVFTLYALDIPTLGLKDGASKKAVLEAMEGHIIKEARLTGIHRRR